MLITWQIAISIYSRLAGAAEVVDEELQEENSAPLLEENSAPLLLE